MWKRVKIANDLHKVITDQCEYLIMGGGRQWMTLTPDLAVVAQQDTFVNNLKAIQRREGKR